ncbi:VOC family protein [Enterococcus canis]|nr:VOC family protein [Enterococcus canis]
MTYQLAREAVIKNVAIRIKNVEAMSEFYRHIIGFTLKREENNLTIFGSSAPESELLLLEETPEGEMMYPLKKMRRLSFSVGSEAELASLLKRAIRGNQPIQSTLEMDGFKGLIIRDPEGNELEFFTQNRENKPNCATGQAIDIAAFAKEADPALRLQDTLAVTSLLFNSDDLDRSHDFFQGQLGIKEKDYTGSLKVGAEQLTIGLHKNEDALFDEEEAASLGLDFVTIQLPDKAAITALHDHLAAGTQPFYIDKKYRILTIFDPSGVEWWFTRPKE